MSDSPSKEEIASRYGEIPADRFMPAKFHRRCVKLMQPRLRPRASVIDLGCGHGTLLACLASLPLKLELHGCDLSPGLVASARARVPAARIVEADLEHLRFPPASFDAAFATEVLEHLLDVHAGLRGIHNVLKPGGWLLVTLPNRDWFHFERYLQERTRFQPVDDRFYSVSEIEAFLTRAGFEVRLVRGGERLYFGGGPLHLLEKIAMTLFPVLQRRMKRMMLLAQKPAAGLRAATAPAAP
ncbi:MAG TPA: methyltransferase domain-containing protein [Methylomirabilota bacterium]|nr:methyltransferase domain-containing protein [Methylomirabilota bacterium]